MGDDTGAGPSATDTERPLTGVRVVQVGTGIAAGYAGKLFVDAGAEVIEVEPPGGDPLRSSSATGADTTATPSPLFAHLAAGKASVVGAPGDDDVTALLRTADLVIDTGEIDPEALRADRPELVVVTITPFGRTGPLAGRPATDFTVQAECGSIAGRGVPERDPVQAGGRTSEWAAGLYGAVAGLAAVIGVRGGAEGTVVDASWMEAMTVSTNLFADPMWSIMKALMGIDPPGDPRSVETPSIHPTADGWIGFNTNGPQHAEAFLRLIERDDLIDEGYVNAGTRTADRHRFEGWIDEWTTRHSTAEILDRAAALRVPTARVNDAATVLDEEQLVARGFFAPSADGRLTVPRAHYRIDGERPPIPAPAPELGSSTAADLGAPGAPGAVRADAPGAAPAPVVAPADGPGPSATRPLEGVKVLDITSWWAGPSNTQLLAALGADVVHVESIAHPDPMRYAAAVMFLDRDRWWELSSFYLCINTNKRGVTLDLGTPEGVALAERLVGWADVVVENYTPRVMPKFGLGWERIHELNPAAVMVRQPAFGLDGPWAERLGFAQNMEQMCGMAFLTGHADEQPLVPRGPCDPLGGAHAAFATLVALAGRARTGTGSLVEVPLIEGALNVTAEPVLEYGATGRVMGRDGNRSAHAAPQGLYRGAGDEPVAVSVATDAQWEALVTLLGDAALADDPELGSLAGRRQHHDRIDEAISAWIADRPAAEAVDALLSVGVPAATLADGRSVHRHPQHQARGYAEDTPHAVLGSLPVFGMPFRMTGRDRWNERPAPVMGEHNAEVLGGLLGLSDAELAALAEKGVIGDRPAGT